MQFFKKALFTEHLPMNVPADSSILTKVLSADHSFFVFPSFFFFLFVTIAMMGVCSELAQK